MTTHFRRLSLAAVAVASLFFVDIAPAVAQQTSPPRTPPSSTVPGGPNGGGGSGTTGGMRSAGCGEFGYANMPSGCLTQAMACICPNDSDPNYRAPSSCEGITRNARRAAERQCANHTGAIRRVF